MDSAGASTSGNNEGSEPVLNEPKRPRSWLRFHSTRIACLQALVNTRMGDHNYMVVGVIFIPIGVAALLASRSVVEIVDEYQTACVPPSYTNNDQRVQYIQDVNTNKLCTRTLTVPKHMKHPIFVYYQLENYYQNHRRYVKSRSDKQLLNGDATSLADTETCKPEQLLDNLPIIPCGLVAWSLFNDTYSFTSSGHSVTINKKGISWKSDREHKFGSFYPENFPNNLPNNQNGSLIGGGSLDPSVPLNENEDLIVWMRTAALPTFRKLYGRIDQDLNAHTQLSVQISNNYNTYSFNGKKKLVLSTTSWLGGKNDFLGVAYITIGTVCIFLALAFFLLHWKHPRPLGDTSYLSWNSKTTAN